MKIKQAKGITLIALVITIIVLLILAGVTITMLTGENGILNQATNAKNATDKSEFEEQVSLAVMAAKTNKTGSINTSDLETELNKISGAEITKSANNELPWTVKKGNYEVTITGEGNASNTEKDNDDVMENAKKAMPTGGTIDKNTNEDTGIVMVDSNGNEWVWVEVPAAVFTSATSSTDYDKIKADLIAYAKDYRDSNWTDEWYAKDGKTLVTASTEGLTESQKLLNNGCGLTYNEYNTKYQKMLSSIYTNKGFYIGRYEAGIAGSDDDTSLARYFSRTEITNDSPKAVSKKDMIPYNYVYCSDAQQLANGMSTGNKTSSLMYGIQWALVCKFLEVKGNWDTSTNTAQYYIKENSTSWGNYDNSGFEINSNKAKGYANPWEDVSGTSKSAGTEILLTTGASEQNKKMNIYDFAGNELEWTLEKASSTNLPCSARGGYYTINGYNASASEHTHTDTTNTDDSFGLRPSLY